jgi:hypothetical protein
MSALGSLADICSAKGHVRFAPNSDRESGFPQTVMSALPPEATCAAQTVMSALGHKRTCANIAILFKQHVGALQKRFWNCEANCLGRSEINDKLEFGGLLYG